MDNLGSFFSQRTEDDTKSRQGRLNNVPSERGNRKLEHPGRYVVKVGEFVWFNKKDPTHPVATPSPEIVISKNGALLLNLSLQVSDKGTKSVPPGASIFHTITLDAAKGADEKKIDNVFRFMRPQMAALLGNSNVSIKEEWLRENCCIEFEEKAGKIVITKHHKLSKEVYITVDFVPDQNGKPRLKVVQLDKLMPGDKSITRKYTDEELAFLAKMGKVGDADVSSDADPGDISPVQETEATVIDTKPTQHLDTSKLTRTEEDF